MELPPQKTGGIAGGCAEFCDGRVTQIALGLPTVQHMGVFHSQAVHQSDKLAPHSIIAHPEAAPAIGGADGQQIADVVSLVPFEEVQRIFCCLIHINQVAGSGNDVILCPVNDPPYHSLLGGSAIGKLDGQIIVQLGTFQLQHLQSGLRENQRRKNLRIGLCGQFSRYLQIQQ